MISGDARAAALMSSRLIVDVSGAFAGVTNFTFTGYYDASTRGNYMRYLQIRDASGRVVCTTNPVYTNVY